MNSGKAVIVLLLFCCFVEFGSNVNQEASRQQPELSRIVRNWAQKFGGELWHFGELVTRRNMVIAKYNHTGVVTEDGDALLKDMTEKIKNMMDEKVKAVKRIMEVAEEKVAESKEIHVEATFEFYNAKSLVNSAPNDTVDDEALSNDEPLPLQPKSPDYSDSNHHLELELEHVDLQVEEDENGEQDPLASQVPPEDKKRLLLLPNPKFYNIPVNTNHSAVHVPSNVYERAKEVIEGIKWSEELDKTFKNNYKQDPNLSWQYFGSSTGFMRQFPAMIWSQEPVDLFDCRTRSWYIEAASSPKDIVILVDRSGSMTGMRREIARHVVNNILDTLGNNDYVNIFTFTNTTEPLIACFNEMLIQANLANVRALKEAMSDFKTEQIANFSQALVTAFRLLETYRENRLGACCNQAIMLITDGVQYNYKEIFKEYNWKNLPFMPVRVFTYLIGREVSDVREVKWMACANRGYYVHLSTYAEVREQVLQYIPVMARPMVLNPNWKPNPTWSPVYADVTDPKLTNWLWLNRERNKQRERFLLYRRNKTLFISDEQDRKFVHQQKYRQDNYGDVQTYRLMTSVSLPVYDKRPNANITEHIQVNEAVWISVTRETRVANLLGVAGTDVPIEYIQKLMMPYRTGVNGYAFVVTNNGYILIHPDLRPVFQGILKPSYNRVDMVEVEIVDDDNEPRNFNESMLELRKNVVMQGRGHVMLRVKTHLDDMRRVIVSDRHYYYMGVNDTPFSVVVALPDKYGSNRVQYEVEDEARRILVNSEFKNRLRQFFTGNWTIHPDWLYCKYLAKDLKVATPEEELLHFLEKMHSPGWNWKEGKECDTKLIKSLVADAKMTDWFSQNITANNTKDENGHEFVRRFGITIAFLATHSGLTRWQDFPQNIDDREGRDEPHFHLLHNKAIDEVWYKRAVEQHHVNPRSFVYSVPFDVGDENLTLVTASHAIFIENAHFKVPVAVVGFQFYQHALHSFFAKITGNCGDIPCKRTCSSEELYCVVLDDNGYIVVGDDRTKTGFFFGDVRPDIMSQLIEEGIYKPIRMFDYQATCFHPTETASLASSTNRFFLNLWTIIKWALGACVSAFRTVAGDEMEGFYTEQDDGGADGGLSDDQPPSKANEKEFDRRLLVKKTKPEPCDQEFWLYILDHNNNNYNKTIVDCSRPYIIQPIINSNLVLLVINDVCLEQTGFAIKSPEPVRVDYNMSMVCHRVFENSYQRRHYMSCMNRSIHEKEIELCGGAGSLHINSAAVFSLSIVLHVCFFRSFKL